MYIGYDPVMRDGVTINWLINRYPSWQFRLPILTFDSLNPKILSFGTPIEIICDE